jgi:hypothetical protein
VRAIPSHTTVRNLSLNRYLAASAVNTGVLDTRSTELATVVSSSEVIQVAK